MSLKTRKASLNQWLKRYLKVKKDLFLKKVDCYCTGRIDDGKPSVVARAIIRVKGAPYPESEELPCVEPLESQAVQKLYEVLKEKLWLKVKEKEWEKENPYVTIAEELKK